METSSTIIPNPSVHQFRDLGKNLLEAAKNGDDSEVRELLTKGASFTTDWLGTSPLHLAAQYGHLSTAQLLMRAGMSWDARTKVNKTPLHLATQFGHIDLAKAFINQGTDLNARDMLNMTPLHWSAAKNQPDIAALLISNGADAKLRNKFDKTAEDICIETGNLKVLELLNKQYTDVPIKETVTSTSNSIPEPLDIVGGDAEKTSEAASSSLLASLSALVNMSTESSNGIVTVEDLARLQAGQITQQSVPIENIRSIILTDAGRLAMQLWNKELEQRVNFPLDKGECEDIQSKTKMDSETSEDREQNYQANQYLTSTLQSDKLSSPLCGREDPITTPSSSVIQPLNFSPNFLDFSNRRLSEPDDNYMLDLDRDILQNQFENARKSNNNSPVKKDIGKLDTPKLSISTISKKL